MRTLFYPLLIILFVGCKKAPLDNGNPSMIYMRDEPANKCNFYTNDVTGAHEKQVFSQPFDYNKVQLSFPNWSADDKVYFLSNIQGENNAQIYSANLDGSNIKRISNCLNCRYDELRISSGNKRLVYIKYVANSRQVLATCKFDGTDEREIINLVQESARYTNWFPDGDRIIYVGSRLDTNVLINNLYSINWDGSGKTRLTNNKPPYAMYVFPSVSPDGKKISYWKLLSGEEGIYVSNVDGTNEQLIVSRSTINIEYKGNWSRDGQYILFTNDAHRLFIIKPDGTSLKQVSDIFSILPVFKDF